LLAFVISEVEVSLGVEVALPCDFGVEGEVSVDFWLLFPME
jgi:hypothetical protein